MRRWSVCGCPEAGAAMSESTTSACPPSAARTARVGALLEEVERHELGPGDRLDLLEVDAEHPPDGAALALAERVHPRHRDLHPAARRAAEVDDARPGLQEARSGRRSRRA